MGEAQRSLFAELVTNPIEHLERIPELVSSPAMTQTPTGLMSQEATGLSPLFHADAQFLYTRARKCRRPGQLPGPSALSAAKRLLRKGVYRGQGICFWLSRLRLRGQFLSSRRAASREGVADGRILRVVGPKSQANQGSTVGS
jgi:hypothetical protein